MKPDGTLGGLRRKALKLFSGFDSPAMEADLLLSGLLGKERHWIHSHPEEPLSDDFLKRFGQACQRRLAHEPIQYILGQCPFWGMTLEVGPGCLVPRPETEYLVEGALKFFSGGLFMDWGCGSGCVALAILKDRTHARGVLVDKNPQSLQWARKNLIRLGFMDRAVLLKSRHPEDLPPMELDMIVSNPPYIPSSWIGALMAEVRDYEPLMALDGGEYGLDPYRWLFELGRRSLKPGGVLCVEFGGDHQVPALRSLAPKDYVESDLIRDCSGENRVFVWHFVGPRDGHGK